MEGMIPDATSLESSLAFRGRGAEIEAEKNLGSPIPLDPEFEEEIKKGAFHEVIGRK